MIDHKNRLGIAGFICMLGGPGILFLAEFIHNILGDFSELTANIIMWACIALPFIGVVLCIICLISWRKINVWGRALSIVTVIMCNPFFYFVYFIICGMSGCTLAGLPWM